MKRNSCSKLLFILLLFSIFNSEVNGANKTFTGGAGFTFGDASKWNGSSLPGAGDNLTINGICIIDNNVLTDNIAYGTLVIGGGSAGTLSWAASGTNTLSVTNVSSSFAGSSFNMTNGGELIIRGTWASTNLAFTPGSGTIEIQSSMTLPAAYTTYNKLTINGTATTVTLGVTISVNSYLTITSGTLDLSNFTANRTTSGAGIFTISDGATLKVGGANNFPINYLIKLIGSASTVDYSGTAQTVAANNYGHLTMSNSGVKTTAVGSVKMSGALTITGSATADMTANSTSVSYNGSGAQTVLALTYYDLTITTSGTKTLAGNVIVNNNLTISFSAILDLSSFTANRATPGGTLSLSAFFSAKLKIGGTNTFPSNYSTHVIGSTTTVEYNGTTQSVIVPNSSQNYYHLVISGSGTKTLAGTAIVAGDLTVSGGTFDIGSNTINRNSAGGTLTVSNGASLRIGGTNTIPSNYSTHSIAATSTVEYSGTTQPVAVLNSSQDYGNLIISGSLTKTLAGTENVAGDLTISAGIFSVNNFNMALGGNWTNNATFTPGTGTVTFNGTTAQIVNGSQAVNVYNLVTDNSSGITLNTDLSVSGAHTFSAGIITTSVTPNYLIYAAGSSYSGDADTRHVNGWITKTGSTDFTFPVGNGTYERSVAVENLSALSGFNVRYNAPTPNTNQLQSPVGSVSSSEYWEINKVSGGTAAIHLNWDNSKVGFPNYILADILVAYFDGSNWVDQGGTATGNALTTGSITSNSLSSFGFFDFGSKSFPLPVNFISFTAKRKDNYTDLRWVTTEEINTDHYEIHRSDDGMAFTTLYSVPSTNRITMQEYTYKDFRALNGIAFYRIRSVDRDGGSKFSKVVTVYKDSHLKGDLRVVNPVNDYIVIYSKVEEPAARFILVNEAGQQMLKGVMPLHAGNVNQINFPFRPAAGTYILKIYGQHINYTNKLMISN